MPKFHIFRTSLSVFRCILADRQRNRNWADYSISNGCAFSSVFRKSDSHTFNLKSSPYVHDGVNLFKNPYNSIWLT